MQDAGRRVGWAWLVWWALGGAAVLAQAPPRRTPPAPAPRGAVPPPAVGVPGQLPEGPLPAPPFELTPAEAAALDQALARWENSASQVRTFKCELLRWEYNAVFKSKTFMAGELRYRNPDQALYRVQPPEAEEWSEYWVCDGRAIFEFVAQQKKLVVRHLPPEMQGRAIEDGPLPFLFSTSAAKLKARYFLRLIQPPANRPQEIWLEAFPRTRQDAANFRRAELILDAQAMLPSAIRIHLPNGEDHTVHQFKDIVVNDPLGFLKGDFAAPKAPRGWERIEEDLQPIAEGEPPPTVDLRAPRQARAPQPPGR